MVYTLESECRVPVPAETVWEFIATPRNLNAVTPRDLEFVIVSDIPPVMFEGLIIEYRIRIPFIGWRRWLTEIKHIREGRSFVDEQRAGPYRMWYHYHEVVPDGDGARLIDRVHYALPFGPAARPVHALLVRPTLERIFRFREQKFAEVLKEPGPSG